MIKKYNDFILENLSTHFDNEYNEFIDIYQNQIVKNGLGTYFLMTILIVLLEIK